MDFKEATHLQPVEGVDIDPLSEDIFMRFQRVFMGKGSGGNYRFIIKHNGEYYISKTKIHDLQRPKRFDTPYPTKPTKTFSEKDLLKIKMIIEKVRFFDLSDGYIPIGKVFEGTMEILEIQIGDKYKRVIFDRVDHEACEKILKAIWSIVYYNHK